jgi:hypothetical protein
MSIATKIIQFPDGKRFGLPNVASYGVDPNNLTNVVVTSYGQGATPSPYIFIASSAAIAATIVSSIDAAFTSNRQTVRLQDAGYGTPTALTNIQYSTDGVTWLTCGTDPNPQSDPSGTIQYYWRANGTSLLVTGGSPGDHTYYIFVQGIGAMVVNAQSSTQFTTFQYPTSNAPGSASVNIEDETHTPFLGTTITFN